MCRNALIGSWIRRFLMEYLICDRNLSRNTQLSYRDTLALLLPFSAKRLKKRVERLCVEDVSPAVVQAFLTHLEQERGCGTATRNQRLACIHALAKFICGHCPEYIDWCVQLQTIPFKKNARRQLTYLEKDEMDALLNSPNRNTAQGFRDYALLLLLYNTGARASEAARLVIDDLQVGESPCVRLLGKGGKTRYCPLWPLTAKTLSALVGSRKSTETIFLNRCGQPITRFGIYSLVRRHILKASRTVPSLRKKVVSPHVIRHTTAVFLLRSKVDINTIRAWLGHVSLDTTNIYAEIDLEMKTELLARCEQGVSKSAQREWREKQGLMAFLKSL